METSAAIPDAMPSQKLGNRRVSRTEPNAENAWNRLVLSWSIWPEPLVSAAAADCAANRLRELARIASRSFFIAVHRVCEFCSAVSAAPLRTAAMPRSGLPSRRPSSTWSNSTASRPSASPAVAAPAPPARISVTRRAIVPANTTCCSAL